VNNTPRKHRDLFQGEALWKPGGLDLAGQVNRIVALLAQAGGALHHMAAGIAFDLVALGSVVEAFEDLLQKGQHGIPLFKCVSVPSTVDGAAFVIEQDSLRRPVEIVELARFQVQGARRWRAVE
jgi:hypothetical protein